MAMNQDLNEYGLSVRDMAEIFRILQSQPAIARVHIFGSRAKGSYHAGSDIDLAIMNKGAGFVVMQRLTEQFRESSLPFVVDLVDYTQLSHAEFKAHIDRVGKLFFERASK